MYSAFNIWGSIPLSSTKRIAGRTPEKGESISDCVYFPPEVSAWITPAVLPYGFALVCVKDQD